MSNVDAAFLVVVVLVCAVATVVGLAGGKWRG